MYNYHTHTKRCGHASGEDEEYVLAAIQAHYDGVGFSDHIMLPNIICDSVRARYEQKGEYLASIKNLKEKYKDQIKLYVGFECEWDSHFVKYYQSLLDNKEVDYLIFGNHGCYFKNGEHNYKIRSKNAFLKIYLRKAVAALNSGLFKIMAHPDLYMNYTPWTKEAEYVATIICQEAKKNNVALEMNCGCILNDVKRMVYGENRYRYPYPEFWKIAKKTGNTIVVGLDAHHPSAFYSQNKKIMEDLIQELQMPITDKLDIG